MSCGTVVAGPLRDSEQTLQGCSEEHRPRDESRDDGCCRAGKDSEQLPSGWLRGVTAGWCGGETQRPEKEGKGFSYMHTHTHTKIWVFVVVCPYMSAMWWSTDLCRVFPASWWASCCDTADKRNLNNFLARQYSEKLLLLLLSLHISYCVDW